MLAALEVGARRWLACLLVSWVAKVARVHSLLLPFLLRHSCYGRAPAPPPPGVVVDLFPCPTPFKPSSAKTQLFGSF